eukprot:SAG22_NODE_905_length_6570_cov_9.540411_1_plen_502_part_00
MENSDSSGSETCDEITFPSDGEDSQLPEYSNLPPPENQQAPWPGPPIIPLDSSVRAEPASPDPSGSSAAHQAPDASAPGSASSSTQSPIFDLGQGTSSSQSHNTSGGGGSGGSTPPEPPATRQRLQLQPKRGATAALQGMHGSIGRLAKGPDGKGKGFKMRRSKWTGPPPPKKASKKAAKASAQPNPGGGRHGAADPAAQTAAAAAAAAAATAAVGGEVYLRVVASGRPELAGKVTGMLLEHYSEPDLRNLLHNQPAAMLDRQIAEAARLLERHNSSGGVDQHQAQQRPKDDEALQDSSGYETGTTTTDGETSGGGGATPMDSQEAGTEAEEHHAPAPVDSADVARLVELVAARGGAGVVGSGPGAGNDADRVVLNRAAERVLRAQAAGQQQGTTPPPAQWLPAALVTIGRRQAAAADHTAGYSRAAFLQQLYGIAPPPPPPTASAAAPTPTPPGGGSRRPRQELSALAQHGPAGGGGGGLEGASSTFALLRRGTDEEYVI